MAKQDYLRFAEMLGLGAVVLSVIFLGYELKRANNIAEGEAISNISRISSEFLLNVASDEQLSEIWHQGLTNVSELSESDRRRFVVLFVYVLNNQEMIWKYFDKGLISETEAMRMIVSVCPLLNTQPDMTFKLIGADSVAPEFGKFVLSICFPTK